MHRYVERAESTARMVRVNSAYLLDVELPAADRWLPLLIVAGEEPAFLERWGEAAANDGERVQDYLTWDQAVPSSIIASVAAARENARTVRDTISLECWEAINAFHLWLQAGTGHRLYERHRAAFYEQVKDRCHLFHGVCHDTMMHEEPFDFMRLGMLLERAGQTARLLDVKYHTLGPTVRGRETPAETAAWLAILRACAAYEAFFKRASGPLNGPAVAAFLLLEPGFPRSVTHCLDRAANFLRRLRATAGRGVGDASDRLLDRLLAEVRA
ncbi:MAG: alpha-E domain-containing protein, partial [Longimicrobiales bacterium]